MSSSASQEAKQKRYYFSQDDGDDGDAGAGWTGRAAALEGTKLLKVDDDNIISYSEDRPFMVHRDSEFTVGSDYDDAEVHNNLNAWQGAALLAADCLGTGLLALPADIRALGTVPGLGFLVLNLPINFFAGLIFHKTATAVEQRQKMENRVYTANRLSALLKEADDGDNKDIIIIEQTGISADYQAINQDTLNSMQTNFSTETAYTQHTQVHHDTATFDFIGMTVALFQDKRATRCTMAVYYVNIFLVLGNYILVMSHAVAAAIGEERICIPAAGLVTAVGMLILNNSARTMAKLGRTASIVSLAALLVVVLQCLWEVQQQRQRNFPIILPPAIPTAAAAAAVPEIPMLQFLRKLSALGSIGFAVGSQKLFLNIRHELRDRSDAPKSLAIGLTAFGACYVLLCLAAGPNPPGFLFDAIPAGTGRRHIGGILLWVHVVVSYSINSQAICSSIDRLLWQKFAESFLPPVDDWLSSAQAATRWLVLTLIVAVSAYSVANAIPFFADLVALIGAVTSVPLTLLLPAMFWRKHLRVPLFLPTTTRDTMGSISLTYFAIAFMVAATIGSLYSIRQDWSEHGPPFSCR